jgi:hypothetical protein
VEDTNAAALPGGLAPVAPVTSLEMAVAEITTLQEAVRTRTTIGQAVGLVMSEKTLTAEGAFAHLVDLSSHSNVKVRDIAASMVEEANAKARAADRSDWAVFKRVADARIED